MITTSSDSLLVERQLFVDNIHRRLDWLLPSWLEDAGAYDQSINEDMVTVYYTVAVNIVIFSFCILFYSAYRMRDDKLFAPKAGIMPHKTPPKLANDTLLGWIRELFEIDDDVLIEKGGYDILFYIRFYRLSFRIFLVFAIYAWGVLLPINGTGNGDSESNSFEVWSMTNIPQGSDRCWYHLVGILILTAITIYFLEKEFVVYAKHRHVFLRQRHAHLRTVLVEGIPQKMRSNVTLATYFETLYPNEVASVKLGQDLRYLDRLVNERSEIVAKLERYLYMCHHGEIRPTVKVGNMLEDVDAVRYYTQMLDDLNDSVVQEQKMSKRLAKEFDAISGGNTIQVIETFLQVTEIGSIRKMLNEKAGGGDKWLVRRQNSFEKQNNKLVGTLGATYDANGILLGAKDNSSKEAKKSASLYGGVDNAEKNNADDEYDPYDAKSRKYSTNLNSFRVYRLTWLEYFSAMVNAATIKDCWRILRDCRQAEDHGEEGTQLISTPEERRNFLSKGFITFKTFTAATTARQVIHMQLAGHLAVSEAPEPTDMAWDNLYITRTERLWRRIIVELGVLMLIIVWVAPVTLLSFVTSEDAIRSYFPLIDAWCADSVWFESFIELVQPGALVALMNLLPPALTFLGVVEGTVSFSQNQFTAFDRYLTFQIINVFLVTTIAGSVIDCIKDIYNDPASTFYLLGNSLPKMGGFFTNYLIMKAFTGLGMEIIRVPAIFSAVAKYLFTSNITPRDRNKQMLFGAVRNMANPGWFPFAKVCAQDTLIVIVCATYACIAPLILIAGLCYFAFASFIYKHQMLYVYEPIFETGGKWWPKLARGFVLALLFAQATMVGMMILKETFTEIYFLAVVILLTSIYYYHVNILYIPLAEQLPFDMATSMDLDLKEEGALRGADDYLQPSLRAGVAYPDVEFPLEKVGRGGLVEDIVNV